MIDPILGERMNESAKSMAATGAALMQANANRRMDGLADGVDALKSGVDAYLAQEPPRYSHRNGEYDKPTLAGNYGFRPDDRLRGWIIHVTEYTKGDMRQISSTQYEEEYTDLPDGRYWGPIVGPWESA